MGAPDCLRPGFRYAEKPHLPVLRQLAHGAHRVLDRHGRVDTVDVREVEKLGAQPPQTPLARRFDVFWSATGGWRSVWAPQIT